MDGLIRFAGTDGRVQSIRNRDRPAPLELDCGFHDDIWNVQAIQSTGYWIKHESFASNEFRNGCEFLERRCLGR